MGKGRPATPLRHRVGAERAQFGSFPKLQRVGAGSFPPQVAGGGGASDGREAGVCEPARAARATSQGARGEGRGARGQTRMEIGYHKQIMASDFL